MFEQDYSDLSSEEMGLLPTKPSSSLKKNNSINSRVAVAVLSILVIASLMAIMKNDDGRDDLVSLFSKKKDDDDDTYEDANNGGSWGSSSEGNPHPPNKLYSTSLALSTTSSSNHDKKVAAKKCEEWISLYNIIPGKSWGTSPSSLKKDWAAIPCDDYVEKSVQSNDQVDEEDFPIIKAENFKLEETSSKTIENLDAPPSYLCALQNPLSEEISTCQHKVRVNF